MPDPDLSPLLAAIVADAWGEPVEVRALRRLSGGASRETWAFEAVTTHRTGALILQRVRGGSTLDGPTPAAEDALLAAADRAGVPVPAVVAGSAACTALGEARITVAVPGEALGPRLVRDDRFATVRPRLAAEFGRALAAVHAIDPATVPGLPAVDPVAALRDGLDRVDEHRPAFELALRWLDDHRPDPVPAAVVHGDFRVGNLLVDETGLTAVLDWELAHVGDPREDLGWLCVRAWRFGGPGEVGGVGSLDALVDAYNAAAAAPVTTDAVRWWIVAGTLRWGVICAVQARRHLDGHVVSVELATIGRRVVENEYDLLALLGLGATAGPDAMVVDHGRPTAAELLRAVHDHLRDVVGPDQTGTAAFQLKVAANALAMVERELLAAPAPAHTVDEAALARALRDGAVLADGETALVVAAVAARLAAANPRWFLDTDPNRP